MTITLMNRLASARFNQALGFVLPIAAVAAVLSGCGRSPSHSSAAAASTVPGAGAAQAVASGGAAAGSANAAAGCEWSVAERVP